MKYMQYFQCYLTYPYIYLLSGCNKYVIPIIKAFDIHFDTNESDNKLILLERRFDVIFTSFSSSIKVRYYLSVHMTSSRLRKQIIT